MMVTFIFLAYSLFPMTSQTELHISIILDLVQTQLNEHQLMTSA